MDISMLGSEEYALYRIAENEVSERHPMKCVCGRLCTGLHEKTCSKFRKSVEKRYNVLLKKRGYSCLN